MSVPEAPGTCKAKRTTLPAELLRWSLGVSLALSSGCAGPRARAGRCHHSCLSLCSDPSPRPGPLQHPTCPSPSRGVPQAWGPVSLPHSAQNRGPREAAAGHHLASTALCSLSGRLLPSCWWMPLSSLALSSHTCEPPAPTLPVAPGIACRVSICLRHPLCRSHCHGAAPSISSGLFSWSSVCRLPPV